MIRGALYWIKESIRVRRIKDLIAIHHRDQILSIGEVNDVMRISRQHVDALDVVTSDFKFDNLPFGVVKVALLNQAVATDHDEELPLGVVPMLALGDARLADVDGDLPAVEGMHQFGKGASLVDVHLQREGHFFLREVAQVSAVKLFGKAVCRYLRNHQSLGLFSELFQ